MFNLLAIHFKPIVVPHLSRLVPKIIERRTTRVNAGQPGRWARQSAIKSRLRPEISQIPAMGIFFLVI